MNLDVQGCKAPRSFWVVVVFCLCGCAHVPAYDRGKLAHPTMAPDYADSVGRAHLQAIGEGAVGGTTGPASGCGCN